MFDRTDLSFWIAIASVLIAFASAGLSGLTLYLYAKSLAEQRMINAWQAVLADARGYAGKREALEYLHGRGVPLVGVVLAPQEQQEDVYVPPVTARKNGIYLEGIQLPGANLRFADLRGADLSNADMRSADLYDADLRAANLKRANLETVDLRNAYLGSVIATETSFANACMRNVDFEGADLEEARFTGADLSGADFKKVKNLKQGQLQDACGTQIEQLPPGFEMKECVGNQSCSVR